MCVNEPITSSIPSRRKKLKKYEYSFNVSAYLENILGVDLTTIPGIDASTALKIFSEIGRDVRKWPSSKHFCSWLALCPGTKISGGRIISGRTKACVNKAGVALRMSANSLYKSQTMYGSYLRKMKSRMAPAQAVTALANKMARTLYYMMLNKESYKEVGVDYYDKMNAEKTIKNLQKRAANLGFKLIKLETQVIDVT